MAKKQTNLTDKRFNGTDIDAVNAYNDIPGAAEFLTHMNVLLDSMRKQSEKINNNTDATQSRNLMDDMKTLTAAYEALKSDPNNKKIIEQLDEKYAKESETRKLEKEKEEIEKRLKGIYVDQNKDLREQVELGKKRLEISEKGGTLEEKFELYLREQNVNVDKLKKGWGEIKNGFNTIASKAKDLAKPWGEVDQAAADYTKHIGGNVRSMNALRKETIDFVNTYHTGIKYGAGMKEIIELQEGYNKAVGRSISLADSHIESLAAMRKLSGDETTIQFADKLQNFGLNPEEAGETMQRIFGDSSKHGLAFEKVTKNFLENIRLAQSYSFANGLNGLRAMAEKATAIRLDLQQTASFADKVSTVEGALQSAAGLSVLGGPFAQFGNPMQMLYEGLNDMEALQDRIINMFGSLASFDSATGEMRVSSFDKQRIRAAAQQTGLNYDDLMTSIQAQGLRNHISGQVEAAAKGDKDIAELLYNTAFMKDKTGFVTLHDENGKKIEKNISYLTQRDIDQLGIEHRSDKDDIKAIASTLTGWDDAVKGIKSQMDAVNAKMAEVIMPNVKNILINAGLQSGLLFAIQGTLTGIAALKGVGSIVNGAGNISGSFGGGGIGGVVKTIAQARGANAAKAASAAKLGKITARGGGLLAAGVTGVNEFFGDNNHTAMEKISRTAGSGLGAWGGAALGASIGTAILPVGGTAIVGIIGGLLGGFGGESLAGMAFGDTDTRANEIIETMNKRGYYLKDRYKYNIDELETILKGKNFINKDLENTMVKNGDALPGWATGGRVSIENITNNMAPIARQTQFDQNQTFATGGSVFINNTTNNNTHALRTSTVDQKKTFATGGRISGFGSEKSDSIIARVSNGEHIINANSAHANRDLLNLINASNGKNVMTSGLLPQVSISRSKNALNQMVVKPSSTIGNLSSSSQSSVPTSIDFNMKPIEIRFSREPIKVDLGSNKISEIDLSNISPALMKRLSDDIGKQLINQVSMGFNKEKYWKKFGV